MPVDNGEIPERGLRQQWLSQFVKAPEGSVERGAQMARIDRALKDPRIGTHLRESYKLAMATFKAQQESGAGLFADETLRYFQRDYQSRLLTHGGGYMPTSYRIAEAFFEERKGIHGFFLLPEQDYIISFTDFLDFVTSDTAPRAGIDRSCGLLPNVIYNINSNDPIGDMLLQTSGESAYAFRGASLVVRGDELVVMLSLGEQATPEQLRELSAPIEVAQGQPNGLNPNKPELAAKVLEAELPVPSFIAGTGLLETTALIRFNLKDSRQEARCMLRDMGATFRTWTDEVASFGGGVDSGAEGFQAMVKDLDEADAIWEVAKTMTLLPSYLAARIQVLRSEGKRTKLGTQAQASLKERRNLDLLNAKDRVLFRTISAIQLTGPAPAKAIEGRSYTPPAFQVPVDGYWRRFEDSQREGHDVDGATVLGKTWVRPHIRFKDRALPNEPKVVYIKASLSRVRQRMEDYRRKVAKSNEAVEQVAVDILLPKGAAEEQVLSESGQHGAFVYVMRCHAHVEHLFKVGFTDRDPETRAKELSAQTSSPTPFVVVQAWPVTDGMQAERAAHAALQSVRLSSNREFFQVEFAQLRDRLQAAIGSWLLPP